MMQKHILNGMKRYTTMGKNATNIRALAYGSRFYKPVYFSRFNSTQSNKAESEASDINNQGEATDKTVKPEEVDEVSLKISELEGKLQKKDKELAEMKSAFQRSIADFRSLQESTKKEIQKSKDFALQKFAKDLLESVDNFARALDAVKEETVKQNDEVKNLYEGVVMTRNVFEKTLQKHGIERITPMGEDFNPHVHEATFELPDPSKRPGTVFHVQQDGYTLNSRVLRPAKVGIVKSEDK